MIRHIKTRFAILLFLVSVLSFSHAPAFGISNVLKPEEQHSISGQLIAKLLQRYHYTHKDIDDEVSSEMLDMYLEKLDGQRLYFLASDIQDFEKYRRTLDDNLLSSPANVDVAYIIFNVYQMRLEQRIDHILARLEQPFDFTLDEEYQIDRSDAPWANSAEELDELWCQRLKNEALSLKLAGKEHNEITETLSKRYQNLERRVSQYNSEDVFQTFMNSLTEIFDPHTSYFSPISSENFNIEMSLSLQGIGARLMTEDEFTKVVEVIPGGPADRSDKLKADDKIIGVAQGADGRMEDVIGMRLDDVVQKIRGPKDSVVRLEILSVDDPQGSPSREITLIRDKIVLEQKAAKSDILEFEHEGRDYKVGVIDVPTFYIDWEEQRRGDRNYKSTTRDVRKLITELKEANVDGIVIDLRSNGGGSLQEAVELTGLFIEQGPVVQVKQSSGDKRVEYDPDPHLFYDGPLAVLVDRFSASASEIFASAIQDYGRGVVVGSQTYGKGTVQQPWRLNAFPALKDKNVGQIKYTMAKFYRVTGATTQHVGVMPDIQLPSIYMQMDVGENKQPHALTWSEISPTTYDIDDRISRYLADLKIRSRIRVMENLEFKFEIEDIDEFRHEQERNAISLNEAKRKGEREQREQLKLDRVNLRRAEKHLDPLAKGDTIPDEDKDDDAVLQEGKLILADLIALTSGDTKRQLTKNTDDSISPADKKSQKTAKTGRDGLEGTVK
jgi:carboxyl-terminal processing protease